MRTPERLEAVTLYVPARNASPTLARCLAAIDRLDPAPARVLVVVDPTSSDDTVAVARAARGVEVIAQGAPGLPRARNLAILAATTEWIASVDGDVVVAPDWLGSLWDAKDAFGGAAMIAGRTEERVLSAGDAWRASMMPHHWGAYPVDGPFMVVSEALARRATLVEVGGYRESLVRYGDDSRLSRDLADAGHRLAYTPRARALHLRRDDVRGVLDLRWQYSAPRQAAQLDDLDGALGKLAVDVRMGRLAVARALAAGEPILALVGALLPVHHAVRNTAGLVRARALLTAPARRAAIAAVARVAIETATASGVPALATAARQLFGADAQGAADAPALGWPRWPAHVAQLHEALAAWLSECAPLLPHEAAWADVEAPAADDVERWAALLGGPEDPSRPGHVWRPAGSVTPWPAPAGPGPVGAGRATRLPRAMSEALAGRHIVTLAPDAPVGMPADARVTIASTPGELADVADDAVVLAALDVWPAPRTLLAAATRRARAVVVGVRGPDRLAPGIEPLLAADLAEAVAGAGMRIRSFETLAADSFLWAERVGTATHA